MSEVEVPAYSPEEPYMDRILPWGMTCREAESKLKKKGLREAWRQVWKKLRADGQSTNDACYNAMIAFQEQLEDDRQELSADDATFIEKAREGLMLDLPYRAGIEKELDWIGANLNRNYPNVQRAPSLWSINYIIDLRLSPKARETFWSTSLSKRLTPGDKSGKGKEKTVLSKDVEDDDSAKQENHEALMKRLFGKDE